VGVVTVDDHPRFRDVAQDVIEATPGFVTVGEASSGEEAVALLDDCDPQLVLVDMNMPGMDGIETTRRIKAARPGVVVVVMSAEDPPNPSSEAGGTGAAAFVPKQGLKPSLLRELWVAHGEKTRGRPADSRL
jgi:DNA-binding NarL/FixJ family response regulator